MNATVRNSRFNPLSSPPPHFAAILRTLAKACRSRPLDKNSIRGECASAHRWYKDRGKSDDCFRFLCGLGILIEEDGLFYFDEERAEAVQGAIDRKHRLEAASATTIRLAYVKAVIAKARVSSPCSIVPDLKSEPLKDATDPEEASPTTDRSSVATQPADVTTTEPSKTLVPAATFHSLPEPTGFIEPQFVLYLTPVEKDVWESAVIQARQIADSKRVGIPDDPERMKSVWGDSRINALPEDYVKALQRFVDADLIRVVGPSGNNHVAYEFVREPELYHVMPIPSRVSYEMSPVYLDILRAIQNGAYRAPLERGLQNHFMEWVSSRWPTVNPKTVYRKMVNFTPDNEYLGYGILYHHNNRCLLSVKGLERFDFVSNNKAVERHIRTPQESEELETEAKVAEATDATQEPMQEPAPEKPPVSIVAEDACEDVDIEAKIRELEESIAQQQSELVAWKIALQRQQDAERDALKRELAEADRLRQEADKRAADARAKLRKLGIENP